MSARDEWPWDSVTFDNYVRMCDEIDRLRAWQRETITWLCQKRLLVEITTRHRRGGGE